MSSFKDSVRLCLNSGKGGKGAVSFRRKRFENSGPPDGGDGGKGGDVLFYADEGKEDFSHLVRRKSLSAEDGSPGSRDERQGRSGTDLRIPVPIGTTIYCENNAIHTFFQEGDEYLLLKGGIGGRGNVHFKSSRQRSPRFSQEGMTGRGLCVRLEYQLRADIGLVGRTNSGKSTVLSLLTGANPNIAAYPFTTRHPIPGTISHPWRPLRLIEFPGFSKDGMGASFFTHHKKHFEGITHFYYVCDPEQVAASLDIMDDLFASWQEKIRGVIIPALNRNYDASLSLRWPICVLQRVEDAKTLATMLTQTVLDTVQKS